MPCRIEKGKQICTRTDWWREAMGIDWYSGSGGSQPPAPSAMIYDNMTATTLSLFWNDVDADNYILERDTTQIYSGADTTFDVTGLAAGNTYAFRVKAQKAGIDSAWFTLNVTVPIFHGAANFATLGDKAQRGARSLELEPSVTGVDRAMSWSGTFFIYNDNKLENNQWLLSSDSGAATQYSLFVISQGNQTVGTCKKIRFSLFTTAANFINITSSIDVKRNRKVHVVVTYDGSETEDGFTITIDGVEDTAAVKSFGGTYTGALDNSGLRFKVSNENVTRGYLGYAKDVAVWNRVLTITERVEAKEAALGQLQNVSFFNDAIEAYWPFNTNYACQNDANLNLTATGSTIEQRAITDIKHLSMQRAEIGNTRYNAFGMAYQVDADSLAWDGRSGTSHTGGGKIIRQVVTASTEVASAPVDLITDGSFDLRGGSAGIIGSNRYVFSSRSDGTAGAFQDARRYKSTDGLTGLVYDAGTVMPPNYLRYNFYGEMFKVGNIIAQTFYGHDIAGTWKLSVFRSEDNGDTWNKIDVIDGLTQAGEAAIWYEDGIWLLLARIGNSPFGVVQIHSIDDMATWSAPVLTNLAGTTGAANVDIEGNSVGRFHVVVMDRSGITIKMSKNNFIHDVIADPLSYNTLFDILPSYGTDSFNVLGYKGLVRLAGTEDYCLITSAEFSSSRADLYFGIGKINEPL